MSDALRFEWVRLRTLRSTYWLTALSLAFSALVGLGALSVKTPNAEDYAMLVNGVGAGVLLQSVLMSLIAIFSLGHEYRYGTIRPTLTALPRRSELIAAKVVVVAGYVLGVTVAALVVRYAVGLAIWGRELLDLGLFPSPVGRVILGVLFYVAVYSVIGLALAGLFRNVPGAIVTLLVVPLIVENIVTGLLTLRVFRGIRPLGEYLPFAAGAQAYSTDPGDFRGDTVPPLPGAGEGAVIFLVFAAVVLGVCWLLFERRDA